MSDAAAGAAAASKQDDWDEMSCRDEVAEVRRGRRRPQHSSGLNNLPTSRWVPRRSRYRGRGKRGGGLEADAEPKMGKNQPGETQRMYV